MLPEPQSIFSLSAQAERSGLSKIEFLKRRAVGNLQRFIDSAPFECVVAFLIFCSVGLVFAEFFVGPSPLLSTIIRLSDILTCFFIAELTLRWIAAPSKVVFFRNFWLDIIAVLPLFRVFRAFRLLRFLRLTRAVVIVLRRSGWISPYSVSSFSLFTAITAAAMFLVLSWTLVMLTVEAPPAESAVSVEHFLDRIWSTTFLFVSGELVGDLPASPWSRLVAVLTSVSGLVVFAVFVGAVSSVMSSYLRVKMHEKDLTLNDLYDHTIICGWDRLAPITLIELESVTDVWSRGVVVIAEVDFDVVAESKVQNGRRLFHIREDFTKVDALERAGARRARSAIILSDRGKNLGDQDRDARTVLAALTLEKINPKIFTCAELLDDRNASHLKIAGVEEVISRSSVSAGLFASAVVNRGISTVISDLLSHKDGTYLRKLDVPKEFVGKEFLQLFEHFKRNYDATIIAIDYISEGKTFPEHHVNPDRNRILQADDKLIVITTVESEFKKLAV